MGRRASRAWAAFSSAKRCAPKTSKSSIFEAGRPPQRAAGSHSWLAWPNPGPSNDVKAVLEDQRAGGDDADGEKGLRNSCDDVDFVHDVSPFNDCPTPLL